VCSKIQAADEFRRLEKASELHSVAQLGVVRDNLAADIDYCLYAFWIVSCFPNIGLFVGTLDLCCPFAN
jgi:hypothetical protein